MKKTGAGTRKRKKGILKLQTPVKRVKLNRKKLIKKLDELASKLCCREWGGKCALCGKAGSQTHHYFSRRHYSLRWEIDNLAFMCFACHIRKVHQGGEIEELRAILIDRIGLHRFFELKSKRAGEATNYKTAQLEELRKDLSKRLDACK